MKGINKRATLRRAACVILTAAMCTTFIAGNAVAFADGKSVSSVQSATAAEEVKSRSLEFENVNGKVNLDAIRLSNLTSQALENQSVDLNRVRTVLVTLKGECLAEQTSDYASFINTSQGQAALGKIKAEQSDFFRELDKTGISYCKSGSYNTVLNAVAIEVNLKNLTAIKAISGVSAVTVSSTYARPKDAEGSGSAGVQHNASSIYENGIYDSSSFVADGKDGSGMTVAILDTGIDYTHEAFDPENMDKNAYAYNKTDRGFFTEDRVAQRLADEDFHVEEISGAGVSDVFINQRIPFAYDYADHDADVYPSYSQHGTHVAGIVAGKAESYTNKDGYVEKDSEGNDIPFRGVAPEAQLVICKVFSDDLDNKDIGGAETVNILNALEDCTKLGVDVINMSLGTSSGFSSASLGLTPEDDEGHQLNRVYSNIRSLGVSLIVAASNEFSSGYGSAYGTNLASNPDSGTIGSPSTFSGAMSVASINGQTANYILANAEVNGESVTGGDAIYYEESRNEDSEAYNFINQMLGDPEVDENCLDSATFRYVDVGGGEATDYTKSVTSVIQECNQKGEKIIALIQRGGKSFKDKLTAAKMNGADAAIVYNNVSGMIRMSLGDMEDPIPSISVSLEAGLLLKKAGRTGTVTLNRNYSAGPFMNDYSSWGTTPDLKLKPDVTAHGGEITSTVAGGYDEMSGTSMACPNLAGFTALLRGYLKRNRTDLYTDDVSLNNLTNQIMMSTATIVYDQGNRPYSPRKQGSGLATLANVFSTKAYLYTKEEDGMCEDGRPKAELGEDEQKVGVYNITYYVKNVSGRELTFKGKSQFFTETLGADKKSVAEKAYLFTGSTSQWRVDGNEIAEGTPFTVAAGAERKIQVTLTLGAEDKKYIDETFINGMYVEGFLQLLAVNDGVAAGEEQCDLSLPFMAFYGDWEAAPLLDYDCFEIAEFDKDNSYTASNPRPEPFVWATQAYAYYYNERYATPLGSYLFVQDEDKEHTADYVYTDVEHIVISRYNEYYGEESTQNYMTVTGIKALYAGLLRNAELVTYTLSNVDTGEIIKESEVYRLNKASASGGQAIPSQVLLELKTEELGLPANGKYALSFEFYFKYEDYVEGKGTDETFDMTFYIDYEAPVLVDSRLRYQDMKDANGKDIQKVYLDLDVFDNTYPQCAILSYSTTGDMDSASLRLATKYITPVINPKKNTTNTVSIDITDIYKDYKGKLFVELDDYALNHNTYMIELGYSQKVVAPSNFEIVQGDSIEIEKNSTFKLEIKNSDGANISNFAWNSSNSDVVKVNNGELFGVSAGTAYVSAVGGDGYTRTISVTVKDSNKTLSNPTLAFGTIINADESPQLATGMVEVNSAQQIKLSVNTTPWYYPIEQLGGFTWSSSDDEIATVDQDGNVSVIFEGDRVRTVKITATAKNKPSLSAVVTLSVRTPFTITNGQLTKYRGWGGKYVNGKEVAPQTITLGDANGESYTLENVNVLYIPKDKAITSIGTEAFKDNPYVQVVIIPKAVTTIGERAFQNCEELKAIGFISTEKREPADASLTRISRGAFKGCDKFEVADFSNCKVFTLDKDVFTNCTGLKKVLNMAIVGTMYDNTFAGCTSLEEVDLTRLHVSGNGIFADCTSLKEVITSNQTALGTGMFTGCTGLEEVTLNCGDVPAYCFARCTNLTKVTLGANVNIQAGAFAGCSSLGQFDCGDYNIKSIGSEAFRSCVNLNVSSLSLDEDITIGRDAFAYVNTIGGNVYDESGKKLLVAAKTVSTNSLAGIEEIGDYAFSGSVLSGVNSFDLTGITKIGAGAFYNLVHLTSVVLPEGLEEIPAYAFSGTGITSIVIPDSVVRIGEGAFAGCSSLESIVWGAGVKQIGAQAFKGTAITSLNLPASVEKVGSEAFSRCAALASVNLTAVKEMGEGVFSYCYSITEAVFGDACTTTGTYTFFTPDTSTGDARGELVSVYIGNGIKAIGDGTFAYCGALETIDLNGATLIGKEAFYLCKSLRVIDGLLNVTSIIEYTDATHSKISSVTPAIGERAFSYCSSLVVVNIESADYIGADAFFFCGNLSKVTFGSQLKEIGNNAFAETALRTVTIPASCNLIGTSAFSGAVRLVEIKVEKDNKHYFSSDGVLYRYVTDSTYEMCAYPAGKASLRVDNITTYEVIEGTVAIGEFAFYGISEDKLTRIILPYSVKLIGNGAFLGCGATSYVFNSIAAPVLLEGLSDRIIENDFSVNSFMYNNFGYIAYMVPHRPGAAAQVASTLTISYPSNGSGYDNYIYKNYFGTPVAIGELPEDDTRTLKQLIESMPKAEDIKSWAQGKSKQEIEQFADEVKTAHILYNGLTTEKQLKYVGEENIQKLLDIEKELKPIKQAMGITVTISNVKVAPESQHRERYTVGESFETEGLYVLVTYSDYSQEVVEAEGNFVLQSRYQGELQSYFEAVTFSGVGKYSGKNFSVRVYVEEEAEEPESNGEDNADDEEKEGKKTPIGLIIGVSAGGAVLVAAVAIAVVFLLKKKKGSPSADGEQQIKENDSDDAAEQSESNDNADVQSEEEGKDDDQKI